MFKIKIFMTLIFTMITIICIAVYISDSRPLNIDTLKKLVYKASFSYKTYSPVADSITMDSLKNFAYNTALPALSYKLYEPIKDLNDKQLQADDPFVIRTLKNKYLFPPSTRPYNLSEPRESNPSMGQAQAIDQILSQKRNGFFVECGALDGEIRSNTLFFERHRGWKGLLIEADPKNFEIVLTKHRKAFMSPTCLATSAHPISVNFQQQNNQGHIVGVHYNPSGGPELGNILDVQCFPLLSYMKALNITTIDYFSLDVEGAEFNILKTIPWKQLNIKTLSVEFIHDKEDKSSILLFMRNQGYFLHSEVVNIQWLANDFIFVKEDLYNTFTD